MTNSAPIVRFAPSPTGRLHIGNIRTALYNWLFAKQQGGDFILRLDDTDQERSTKEFAQGIVEDLAWLGMVADRTEKQSDRFKTYDAVADDLRARGLLYPCYESAAEIDRKRKRLMARGLPPVYDRAALKLTDEEKAELEAKGQRPHWRFLLPNYAESPFETQRTEVRFDDVIRGEQTVDLASMSDPVLIREDGTYLYTLPSVVDDLDMGVTHVIRGGDHITNTGAQIAIFEAVGQRVPQFGHHNLLQDASGEGLSKRTGALSIASLRETGFEPMAVASLATLIGTGQAVEACANLTDLAAVFDPSKVSKSNAKFSVGDLDGLNDKLLHEMDYGEAQERLVALDADLGEAFWLAVRPNIHRFAEVRGWVDVVEGHFEALPVAAEDAEYISTAAELLPAEPWDETVWPKWTGALKERTGRKGKQLFMPLRKALTGLEHGPDMRQLLPVIGWERTRRRLP
ncbi:MAG: glutamate--tRNA ligase [Rhizobiaceae bacterium]|nr:glutamate--tRNA ligase [Hyphomicrobiales bacterium]NRB29883.1 glutamate--tRNA ligase [Rhizobiaceae bacterium]